MINWFLVEIFSQFDRKYIMIKRNLLRLLLIGIFSYPLFSQAFIGSFEEQRNYDSFPTNEYGLFDSVRSYSFNTLKKEPNPTFSYQAEILSLSTYNTFMPHGMNDESFWQGKGANSYLSAGIQGQIGVFQFTLMPDLWFAENKDFELIPPKVGEYGSFLTAQIDNPQRYGDSSLFFMGFGQSEIRYLGEHLTIGLGTQSFWLGPGNNTALIMSNNAGGFPKVDIGFNDIFTRIGEFEFFLWWGALNESEYFDTVGSNDWTLNTGLHILYKPSFIEGFSVGLNRVLIANFEDTNLSSYTSLFIPYMSNLFGYDKNDQRASITLNWEFPKPGFKVYAEWARNDYSPSIQRIIEFPQRTQAYTLGVRQKILSNDLFDLYAAFETSELLVSWDYTINGSAGPTFYSHHFVTKGYTQNGQILGAGIGSGANAQFFDVSCFFSRGSVKAYVQRIAKSQDYLFTLPLGSPERNTKHNNVEIAGGVSGEIQLDRNNKLLLTFEYSHVLNWNYIIQDINNFYFQLGYNFVY